MGNVAIRNEVRFAVMCEVRDFYLNNRDLWKMA